MVDIFTRQYFQEKGKQGGETTKARYPTEVRKEWGKKGGRPKKKK